MGGPPRGVAARAGGRTAATHAPWRWGAVRRAQGAGGGSLLKQGLTLSSSQVGSFFYLIIGAHAVHVVCALGILAWCWSGLLTGTFRPSRFGAAQLLWYFVVLVWPVLWLVVYR